MLETSRLKLVPLTHEQLLLYKNEPEALAENLQVIYSTRQHDPAVAVDHEEAIEFWIKNTKKFRDYYEWFTNWEIIIKEERIAIGGIGFAGLPDEEGKSMVGYGLDVRYHNRGYATEALKAILAWGFKNQNLKRAVADTPVKNFPSHRVLIKNGFQELSRDEHLILWYLNRC